MCDFLLVKISVFFLTKKLTPDLIRGSKYTILPLFCAWLVACGGGGGGGSPATPSIDAGDDQSVTGGRFVTLEGTVINVEGAAPQWRQLSGPFGVTIQDQGNGLAIFMMPDVNVEDMYTFEFSTGGELKDTVNISHLYSYEHEGDNFGSTIERCVDRNHNAFQSCQLSELPLIGMQYSEIPSVEDIMSRVVVTHSWMAERFKALLSVWPQEIRQLFRSTTSIVIARTIRPSFFTPRTGAIYIDPSYLWLTLEEKADIETSPDFRSDFQKDLNFIAYGRYVNGPGLGGAYSVRNLTGQEERTLEDIEMSVARLMFHELAHANDFYPVSEHNNYSLDQTIYDVADPIVSDNLHAIYPLENIIMSNLGQVMFRGTTASDEQKALTPTQVGAAFDADAAVDDYAYAKFPREGELPQDVPSYEDTAMLFEAVMMKYLYGKDRAFAVFDKPTSNNPISTDYVVRYGHYNRIGEDATKVRAQLVAEELFPEIDWDAFFTNIEGSTDMTLGISWWNNITSNLSQPTAIADDIEPILHTEF